MYKRILVLLLVCMVGLQGGIVFALDTGLSGLNIDCSTDPDCTASTTIFQVQDTSSAVQGLSARGDGTFVYVKGSDVATATTGNLDIGAGHMFDITGTNLVNNIETADTFQGRFVFLQFDSTPTVGNAKNGGNIDLCGGADVVMVAGDVLHLLNTDGTRWHEVCLENTQQAD